MPTCPNCGELVMNGDPYCSNCGATFRWVEDEEYEMKKTREYKRPVSVDLRDVPVGLFYKSLEKFCFPDDVVEGIMSNIDISQSGIATVDIRQEAPRLDIDITFKRQNKYFATFDYITYDYFLNEIAKYGFSSRFDGLKDADWFKKAVRKKEIETGLKFYDCGGGYDANWDLNGRNAFELKKGCKVIAHFNYDEYFYWGYEVDFKNHTLKNEYEEYDKKPPFVDYDW